LSERLAKPKEMINFDDLRFGLTAKENFRKRKKKTNTSTAHSAITNYFNTLFFQAQNMKKSLRRTKRPMTAGDTIQRYMKMTKNGPMKFRRVLSKRIL
jgi:hypothetical protein